jgi:hypothetical protein
MMRNTPSGTACRWQLAEGMVLGSPSRRLIRSVRSKSGSIRTKERSSARAAALYEVNSTTRTKYATTPPMRATDQTSSSTSV